MLQLTIAPSHAEFLYNGRLVGRYNYRDAYKPHFHPLTTPLGHVVTVASPHDHVHHKGLMYALRTPQVNFWEERSTLDGEVVGAQRHEEFSEIVASGGQVGFRETLDWVSTADDSIVFAETREIRCSYSPQEGGYGWTWHTHLVPRERTVLIQSQWSHKLADGHRVNYHGLGVRLRRESGGPTKGHNLWLDGKGLDAQDFAVAMGCTPACAMYVGSIDGTWPVERASVTLAQEQRDGLFVLNTPFAFMAMGPSNLGEVTLEKGQALDGWYRVVVADWSA